MEILFKEPLRCAVLVPLQGRKVLMAYWMQGRNKGLMGCPGGKINSFQKDEKGAKYVWESPEEAAWREAKEEAGIDYAPIHILNFDKFHYLGGTTYDETESDGEIILIHTDFYLWDSKEQAIKYTNNLEPTKLSEWQWVDIDKASLLVHPIYKEFVFPRIIEYLNK